VAVSQTTDGGLLQAHAARAWKTWLLIVERWVDGPDTDSVDELEERR